MRFPYQTVRSNVTPMVISVQSNVTMKGNCSYFSYLFIYSHQLLFYHYERCYCVTKTGIKISDFHAPLAEAHYMNCGNWLFAN